MERIYHVYENATGYLKNYWTKHRLVCIHVDPFAMLIPNMDKIFKNSEFLKIFWKKNESAIGSMRRELK